MSKKTRLMSILVSLALLVGILPTAAFAADEGREIQYYRIDGEGIERISAFSRIMKMSDQSTVVKITKTVSEQHGEITTTLTSDDLKSIPSNDEKIMLANTILEEIGYSQDAIDAMEESKKLDFISTDLIQAKTTYYAILEDGTAKIVDKASVRAGESTGSDYTAESWMQSTLTYSRISRDRYLITNYCKWLSVPTVKLTDRISIAVQGFSADFDTASCVYMYNRITNGVQQGVTHTYTNNSSTFDTMSGADGGVTSAGVSFSITLLPWTATTQYDNISVQMSCYFDNSMVNSPGGSFNIYGCYAHKIVSITEPAFSYPWGVSTSLATNYSLCKTQTRATIY